MPGSVADPHVFRLSELRRRLEEGWRLFPGSKLLGDSIYPASDYLTPMVNHPPAHLQDFYE
jgi:hypothetical protein